MCVGLQRLDKGAVYHIPWNWPYRSIIEPPDMVLETELESSGRIAVLLITIPSSSRPTVVLI